MRLSYKYTVRNIGWWWSAGRKKTHLIIFDFFILQYLFYYIESFEVPRHWNLHGDSWSDGRRKMDRI